MNAGRDAFIIILLLVGLGIALVVLNSQAGSIYSIGSGVAPTMTRAERSSSISQRDATVQEDELTEREIERQIRDIEAEIAFLEKEIEYIETYGERSPYQDMVSIRKFGSGPRATDVDREYIQLETARGVERSINVSQWKLTSSVTGRSVEIGNAVTLFFSGDVNVDTPLILDANEKVYVTTGRSPIGESFQVNKCSGYFNQFQDFYPNIQSKCPDPEEEILYYTRDRSIFIDNACMDFVERIPRCRIQTKQLPLTLSFACQEAIFEEINYNSCVEKHKSDPDFYTGDWRIYLKRGEELWREKRELILLLDENGKTVDYYNY